MKKIVIIGANDFQNQLILKAKQMGYETHVFAWRDGAVGAESADYFYPVSIVEVDQILEKCRQIQLYGCVEGLYLPEHITVYMIVRSFDLPYESYASCCYPAESQFGVLRHDFVGVFFKVFSCSVFQPVLLPCMQHCAYPSDVCAPDVCFLVDCQTCDFLSVVPVRVPDFRLVDVETVLLDEPAQIVGQFQRSVRGYCADTFRQSREIGRKGDVIRVSAVCEPVFFRE